jgi:hypothetical protein
MAEWSNAAVLKTVVPLREPGVRIPFSPRLRCEIGRERASETLPETKNNQKPRFLKSAAAFCLKSMFNSFFTFISLEL